MIRIELFNNPVFRGQSVKGRVHVSSEDGPYTAKRFEILMVRTEKYRQQQGKSASMRKETIHNVLFRTENLGIGVGQTFDFTYLIPENAFFTFNTGLSAVQWEVQVVVKRGFFPKKVSEQVVVLPHVAKSETLPSPDRVPAPQTEVYGELRILYRPFHAWRYTGFLHRCESMNMLLDEEEYTPGDSVRGTLTFSSDFMDADLTVYLVFLTKSKGYDVTEVEEVIAHVKDNFYTGSAFPFSCSIPEERLPSLRTNHSRIWWVVRAVLSRRFAFTKVVEREIQVNAREV